MSQAALFEPVGGHDGGTLPKGNFLVKSFLRYGKTGEKQRVDRAQVGILEPFSGLMDLSNSHATGDFSPRFV